MANEPTPGELAEERELPNNGLHWTDWVNDRTKHRIISLFDAIDTKAKMLVGLGASQRQERSGY